MNLRTPMVGRGYVPMVARRSRRWKNGNKQRHACTATTTERFQLSSSPFRPTRLLLLCIFTYTYFTTLICCLPATPVSLYLCRLAFNLHTLEVCAVCTRNYPPTEPEWGTNAGRARAKTRANLHNHVYLWILLSRLRFHLTANETTT